MPNTENTATDADRGRTALAERLIADTTVALEVLSVHLGLELGLYEALREHGPATEATVAKAAEVAPRYAREWLEQQAAASLIGCVDPAAPAGDRLYHLPAGYAEVLLDRDSPYHCGPLATMTAGVARAVPHLPAAYRTGGGVPYHAYGAEIRDGIAGLNRPGFALALASEWIAAMPDVAERLRASPAARVLDLGCGLGASSVALAQAYPRITVTGVDLDPASVAGARDNAAAAGVADRVSFVLGDAAVGDGSVGTAAFGGAGRYDLATLFESLHDMGDPVGALTALRGALVDGGSVLIADELVADEFAGPAEIVERLQYGFSVLHCLPATMAEDPVEAAGTVLRAPTVARWAAEAGFTRFEKLPIVHDFWQFYRLG